MSELKVLIDEQKIAARVAEVAKEVTKSYSAPTDEKILIAVVLRGAFIFASDLLRHLEIPVEIDFIELSSYDGELSTGQVHWHKDFRTSVKNRHVLIIEDIVDTGLTMKALREILLQRGASSVRVCSFLSKSSRRQTEVEIDFLGFEIEDRFVVGYGLDFDQSFRNRRDLCIVQK